MTKKQGNNEIYISVDVEAAGPNPSDYSLLSIGACLVSEPDQAFYVELKPVNERARPEAMAVCDLSLTTLAERGLPPAEAMSRFAAWVNAEVPNGQHPVFVGFNAPFDWMFINDYFHRFLGHNPFGYAALDLKAFYMGMTGLCWSQTRMEFVAERYLGGRPLTHNALRDAQDQAEIFRAMLREREGPSSGQGCA